jgi:hypothetical protein
MTEKQKREWPPDEQKIIDAVEKYKGRKLSSQEENFAIQQAREIGDLDGGILH